MRLAKGIRQKIKKGKSVFGTFIVEMKTPAAATILKNSGFDFFIVDTEHGYFDTSQIAALITAGKKAGICPMVRIPGPARGLLHRTLDAGAEGILVPMVRKMEDVVLAVNASKYPPMGLRGLHFLRPHTEFNPPVKPAEYMKEANRSLITAIQIETREAVDMMDDIASANGVDMLYIGPGDLSTAYGHLGVMNTELILETAEKVIQTCRKHGKLAAMHLGDTESLPELYRMGYRFFGRAAALRMFWEGASAYLDRAKLKIGEKEKVGN